MKNALFTLALLLTLALAPTLSQAQNRDWGVGLRFGSPSAFTVKHYMGRNAWDLSIGTGYAGIGRNGYGAYSGLGFAVMFNYLWQKPFSGTKDFTYYYGIGGLASNRPYYYDDRRRGTRSAFGLGATGALGIEYFIPDAPISLFAEINPYVEIVPAPLYITLGAAFGGRFTF